MKSTTSCDLMAIVWRMKPSVHLPFISGKASSSASLPRSPSLWVFCSLKCCKGLLSCTCRSYICIWKSVRFLLVHSPSVSTSFRRAIFPSSLLTAPLIWYHLQTYWQLISFLWPGHWCRTWTVYAPVLTLRKNWLPVWPSHWLLVQQAFPMLGNPSIQSVFPWRGWGCCRTLLWKPCRSLGKQHSLLSSTLLEWFRKSIFVFSCELPVFCNY